MRELISKLLTLEQEMADEKGAFTFYAFLKPYDSIGEWDFVVSAKWSDGNSPGAIKYIAKKLYKVCTPDEMMNFSRTVVLPTNHPDLEDILEDFDVEHGVVKMNYSHYFSQEFQRGYVFTGKLARASGLALGHTP